MEKTICIWSFFTVLPAPSRFVFLNLSSTFTAFTWLKVAYFITYAWCLILIDAIRISFGNIAQATKTVVHAYLLHSTRFHFRFVYWVFSDLWVLLSFFCWLDPAATVRKKIDTECGNICYQNIYSFLIIHSHFTTWIHDNPRRRCANICMSRIRFKWEHIQANSCYG